MDNNFSAKAEITMNTSPAKVWEALTNPTMVKEYLFGTDMTADWKVGGKISYKGVWEGKPYEDKGEILELVPEKLLVSTYWSGFSGLPDVPENYQKVTYSLASDGEKTTLSILQENAKSQESADHSAGNWKTVLEKMKEIVEK